MKRYFLLTSVLALAACGGGGAGVDGVPAISGASNVRSAFLSGATDSNSELTSMTSAIVVADDNSEPAVYRTAVHKTHNGKNYTVFNLSDVDFHIAENPAAGHFQFTIDEHGTITEISETLEGGTVDGVQRIGTTQRFNTPIFEYVKDKYANFEATVTDNDQPLLDAIKTARGFGDGTWETTNNGSVWQYRLTDTDELAKVNNTNFTVNNNTDDLLAEIKEANHFGDGKWEPTVSNNSTTYKYVEYGDKTLKRVADTGQDMTELNNLADGLGLGHWNRIDEILDISTEGEAVGLTFSDFGKFNPVYRSKHKNIEEDGVLFDIRNQETNINAKLDENQDVDELATIVGLNRADKDEYKTAAERENEFNTSEDFQLFAGGYAIKDGALVTTLIADRDTSYTGTAIGRVYTSIKSDGVNRNSYLSFYGIAYDTTVDENDPLHPNNAGHDMAKVFTTNAATIDVSSDGKQTLSMPFFKASATDDKFYNITVVDNGKPTFDTKDENGVTQNDAEIAKPYRLFDIEDHYVAAESGVSHGFYGVETPSEAAGTARWYFEQDIGIGSDDVSREYEIQAAWGMKKD